MKRLYTTALGAFALLVPMLAGSVEAADYPERAVTIIVTHAPGGGVDLNARLVAQHLSDVMGKPFIVENHPGAGGTIAVRQGMQAPPDGYVLTFIGATYSVNPALYPVEFDPVEEITPIVQISQGPLLLVARPGLGAETAGELIAKAKAEPGKIISASVGPGSITHMASELFAKEAGIEFTTVQYNGVGQAMNDVLGGRADICFCTPASVIPHVKAGTLHALGVTSLERVDGFDFPTVLETGGPPGYESQLWYGLIGPNNMPSDVVERINAEVNEMLKTKAAIDLIESGGHIPVGGPPDQFKAKLATEVKQWIAVGEAIGLKTNN